MDSESGSAAPLTRLDDRGARLMIPIALPVRPGY